MKRLFTLSAVLIAASLAAVVATPAVAAGGGDPKIRVTSRYTVTESEFTSFTVRYRCAEGTTATLTATARQGGTESDPVSLYDTSSPAATVPTLICDGDKHVADLGLILVGYDETEGSSPYESFTPTSLGGGKVFVTVTVSDDRTGRSDVDHDRMAAIDR